MLCLGRIGNISAVKRRVNTTFVDSRLLKKTLHICRDDIKSRQYGNVTAVATWFGEFLVQTANYWHESGTVYDTSVIMSFDERDMYFTINAVFEKNSSPPW